MPTSIVDNSSTNIIRPNLELSQQVHTIIDPTKLTADDLAQLELTSGQTWKVDDDGAMVIVVPKPDDPGIVNADHAWSLIDQTNGARLTKYGSKYKLTAKAGQSSGGDTGGGDTGGETVTYNKHLKFNIKPNTQGILIYTKGTYDISGGNKLLTLGSNKDLNVIVDNDDAIYRTYAGNYNGSDYGILWGYKAVARDEERSKLSGPGGAYVEGPFDSYRVVLVGSDDLPTENDFLNNTGNYVLAIYRFGAYSQTLAGSYGSWVFRVPVEPAEVWTSFAVAEYDDHYLISNNSSAITRPGITNPGGSGPVITNPDTPTATMNFGDVEPNSTTFVWVQRSFIDNNGPSFSFSDSELAGCSITPSDLTGASVSGTGPYNIMSWPICNISSSSDGYMIRVVGDFSSGSWDDYCLVTMVLDGSTYRASQVFYISEEPEWNTTGETIIYAGDPPAQPYANVSFIPSEPASASIFAWIDKDFMDDDPNHVFTDGELDGAILTWPQLSDVPVTKSGDGYVVQSWSVANAVSVGESTMIRVNDAFSSGNQNDYYLVKLTTISTNQYAMSDIYKVTTTNWSVDGSSLLVVVAPA